MKLVDAKIQYACGTVLKDRVAVDPASGEVLMAQRVINLMAVLKQGELRSAFDVSCGRRTFPVIADGEGKFRVKAPLVNSQVWKSAMRSIACPNRAQRHQNGRFVHLLSVMAVVASAVDAITAPVWNAQTITEIGSLMFAAVLLGMVGFYCNGD
jgi:hypothetical protein